MRHVVTHPYRPSRITPGALLAIFWLLGLLTVLNVIYQHHMADQRACVRDLTTAWSADPKNVDKSLPDYAWFEEQCR